MEAYWTTARWGGRCAECGADINPGDRIAFDADARKTYCEECGEDVVG